MDWISIAAGGALALGGINLGLTAFNWKRNDDMAQRMPGLLQKFREAVATAADAVTNLVTANAKQAAEIVDLREKLDDANVKLAEIGEDTIVVTNAEFDEASDLVAGVQKLGTAASMPLMPES